MYDSPARYPVEEWKMFERVDYVMLYYYVKGLVKIPGLGPSEAEKPAKMISSTFYCAGHNFIDNRCGCGQHWFNIRNSTSEDLNQPGIAHIGKLNEVELAQIRDRKKLEDAGFSQGNI